ncbi:MAG: hypothetical protein ACF8R9_11445 [Phycisphaerales bacterium JB054]
MVLASVLGGVTTVGGAWWAAHAGQGGSVWINSGWLGLPATASDDLFKYMVVRAGSSSADAVEAHAVSLEPAAVYDAFAGKASEAAPVPSLNALNASGQARTGVWGAEDRRQIELARPARGRDVFRVEWRFGRPWRSMALTARAERPAAFPNPNFVTIGRLAIESDGIQIAGGGFRGSGVVGAVLPLRPVWPGFAANWAVFGGVWVVVLVVPGLVWRAVRGERRRRAGRCPACGYELEGRMGEGCSECGWGRGDVVS